LAEYFRSLQILGHQNFLALQILFGSFRKMPLIKAKFAHLTRPQMILAKAVPNFSRQTEKGLNR